MLHVDFVKIPLGRPGHVNPLSSIPVQFDRADTFFVRLHINTILTPQTAATAVKTLKDKPVRGRPGHPQNKRNIGASQLIRNAHGTLVLAHPNDPNGTSLIRLTTDLDEQTKIIKDYILEYVDGVECWHSRNDAKTTAHYMEFARKHSLMMTGGSDCHQKPLLMGTLDIPDWVADQFSQQVKTVK